ncbi:asparagine synthase (glutamine-hydrolyzing) [Aliidiomarina celeris]|uniref:asparagine synthase (glutamine-hydrolyzing) n=1 Tax=Aliidiomarina celeris TaxID=2249428 RepID=UPI000DE8BE82|nr:asparagine synthase (glutamine-hydrolyzing) [Aliidiomarina celeris]
MCGILGWYGNATKNAFIAALHLQQHRGPDDWGYQRIGQHLQLGHRRLSIIDLASHSRQPMTSVNGRFTAVFNGEIYNYADLKKQLLTAGYDFRTDSDTEVLINGWDYWGAESVHRFIGMFAFAIFCHETGSLTLVRDRFGIKPLYVYHQNNEFGFASEAKSLLALMPTAPTLNLTAVASYFSFRYPLTTQSFFEEIRPLPPGHMLHRRANGEWQETRYYCLAQNIPAETSAQDPIAASNDVRALFQSSVEYRMISDVPIGAYLSGGVDSSAVVAAMSKASRSPIKTFTVGFEEAGFNEFDYAAIVAKKFQTEHHEIVLSNADYLDNLRDLICYKDAPLGVPNEVPLYLMSKVLKQQITVVLSGEGADEIFAGYGRLFRSADDYNNLKLMHDGKLSANSELTKNLKARYGTKQFITELDHFLHLYRYIDFKNYPDLFSDELVAPEMEKRVSLPLQVFFEECPQKDYASKMLYSFEHLHLPGLLQRVDSTTMAAGVEARVPFVDHRLVELAFSLPMSIKMAWKNDEAARAAAFQCGQANSELYDIPKAVLKHAFEGELPHDVLHRRKVGFPVPLAGQLKAPLQREALKLLPDGQLVQRGLLKKRALMQLLLRDSNSQPTDAMLVWMLLNLELFLQQYFRHVKQKAGSHYDIA